MFSSSWWMFHLPWQILDLDSAGNKAREGWRDATLPLGSRFIQLVYMIISQDCYLQPKGKITAKAQLISSNAAIFVCQITSYRVLFARAALNEHIMGRCVCQYMCLGVLSPKLFDVPLTKNRLRGRKKKFCKICGFHGCTDIVLLRGVTPCRLLPPSSEWTGGWGAGEAWILI